MKELGFDVRNALSWFPHETENPYTLVRISEQDAAALAQRVQDSVRRCYLSDDELRSRITELEEELGGTPEDRQRQVIASKIPDPGPIMSGDFGEILVYFYQAVAHHPAVAFGPKKWRLKQDRTKSAPYSDVLHLILPTWPMPSEGDMLLCAEVKTKATNGGSTPITDAIEDCAKDRTSRLANTLAWLRDRAISKDLGAVKIAQLNRFINANDFPAHLKRFRAVAVVCATLLEAELEAVPHLPNADFTLVVISVPNLRAVYTEVFEAVRESDVLSDQNI